MVARAHRVRGARAAELGAAAPRRAPGRGCGGRRSWRPRSRRRVGRSSARCGTPSPTRRSTTQPALTSLPAPGPLLVNSKTGPWIVQRRRLEAAAGGLVGGRLVPERGVRGRDAPARAGGPRPRRWRSGGRSREPASFAGARWSSEVNPRDTRIAYLNRRSLRIVGGNGKGDKELRKVVGVTAPAWRPEAFELAFSTVDGRIELVDAETGQDGVANRPRRGADPARLVGGR